MDRWQSLIRFGLTALLFIGTAQSAQSQAPQAIPPQTDGRAGQPQSRIYNHPTLGYKLAVPPGAEVQEREGDNTQISIRSRSGYKITLQAGASRHQIPLKQLPAIIEAQYFGKGKPWNRRLEDRTFSVAGLDAYEVNYEGSNNRSQVVFVRGQKLDYVFIFIAGIQAFPAHIHEFEWVLKNFSPVKSTNSPKSKRFQTRAIKFAKPGFGYAMLYPADWEQSQPAAMTIMFSGRPGTPAYTSIVSVQNIEPPGSTGPENALKRAIEELKASLGRSVPDVKFSVDRPWTYAKGGVELLGRELDATYKHAGQRFRKVMFIVPRPFQAIAHIWSYTAPEKDFQIFQPLAEQMLKSWVISSR
jgi:hypothetical protein